MRYRAILITTDPLPRPIQCFFNDLEEAKKWADVILKSHPNIGEKVQIWQTIENLAANVWPN